MTCDIFNLGFELVPLCFEFIITFRYIVDTSDVMNNPLFVANVQCD